MKAPYSLLLLAAALVSASSAYADGNCPEGQIEKAFYDGGTVSYQCLEASSAGMVDDTDVQYGGVGDENGSGGADPPPEE